MKLSFVPDLQFRQDALKSVTVLFESQPMEDSIMETRTPQIDLSKLKVDEQLKIKCGKAHFNEFDEIEYKVVNKVGQLIG